MAHKIDTPNAVETMPVAAAAGTGGWFADNNPLAITELDADWCNMVQGELMNIVTAFGGTLNKAQVNQIATVLTEYVLTNGRFSTSLAVGPEKSGQKAFSVGFTDVGGGDYIISLKLFGQKISEMDTRLGGVRRSLYATYADLGSVVADKGLTTVTPEAEPASWDSGASAFTGTLNAVGGAINVAADVTNPIPGNGYEDVVITNSKVATTSRIHVTMTYQSDAEPVIVSEVESLAGSFRVRLRKLGTGDVTGYVGFHFDVINPV